MGIVKENAEWVPPVDLGALYLRPLLLGTGPDLGVKPSSEYTFVIFCSPVGSYFKSGVGGGVRLKVCLDHQRAAPMGIGHVKAAGNYAPCFRAQREAKADGYSDIIYLDVGGEYIEEAAASNFFCVDENNVVRTPQLGTILPGVTRDSVINLARRLRDKNIQLQVGRVSLQQRRFRFPWAHHETIANNVARHSNGTHKRPLPLAARPLVGWCRGQGQLLGATVLSIVSNTCCCTHVQALHVHKDLSDLTPLGFKGIGSVEAVSSLVIAAT